MSDTKIIAILILSISEVSDALSIIRSMYANI